MIYFIQMEHPDPRKRGPIKIGFTDGSVADRLSGLQTSCPYDLHVLGVIPLMPIVVEEFLHSKFASFHLRGEWFRYDYRIESFIRRYALGYEWGSDRPKPLKLPFEVEQVVRGYLASETEVRIPTLSDVKPIRPLPVPPAELKKLFRARFQAEFGKSIHFS